MSIVISTSVIFFVAQRILWEPEIEKYSVAKENDKMIMEMYGLEYDEFFPPSHSDEE
jgi:hypothetical protein